MRAKRIKRLFVSFIITAMVLTVPCGAFAVTDDGTDIGDENQSISVQDPGQNSDEEASAEQDSELQLTDENETGDDEETEEPVEKEIIPDPIDSMGWYPSHNYGKYKGKNAKSIPVITYHRICTPEQKSYTYVKNDDLYISTEDFDMQMQWLYSHGYRTLDINEFYKWRKKKMKLPAKSVLITFDDGDYNAAKYAVPILAKYRFKATMFVIGINTGNTTRIDEEVAGEVKPPEISYIGWDKIKQIRSKYPDFVFQGHSWNMHRRITSSPWTPVAKVLTWKDQRDDLKHQISSLGFKYLAYPYGSYNKNTVKACKKAKIKMAFTYGKNARATRKQNIYKIKRIKVSGGAPMWMFTRWF